MRDGFVDWLIPMKLGAAAGRGRDKESTNSYYGTTGYNWGDFIMSSTCRSILLSKRIVINNWLWLSVMSLILWHLGGPISILGTEPSPLQAAKVRPAFPIKSKNDLEEALKQT